jgi:twitching motility protein PilT
MSETTIDIHQLLKYMVQHNASDLHICAGLPPLYRIDGEIIPSEFPVLNEESAQALIYSLLTEEQKQKFELENELDVAFGFSDTRIRMNVFRERGNVAAALRNISLRIPTFEELGLPPVVNQLVKLPKGLILVTGPTGSGKSTTLASMIDYINSTRRCHIITIEDPIEFIYQNKKAVIHQREVGSDTKTFAESLRRVLRQDPDVILIGEMRDLETIQAALVISETGHLVFGTLHTPDTIQTINRIIDVFPPHQQNQVRTQLSFVLQGILAQQLLPRANSPGRVLAVEVLIPTPAIRNLIRENKPEQIYSHIQTGAEVGMQTMNKSLYTLYTKGLVTYQEIMNRSADPKELQNMIRSGG